MTTIDNKTVTFEPLAPCFFFFFVLTDDINAAKQQKKVLMATEKIPVPYAKKTVFDILQ